MKKIEHLYDVFKPSHYNVFIDINRANKTINGKVTVKGIAESKEIFINQKFLNISSVKADGKDVPFKFDDSAEAIQIDLDNDGEVTLEIVYDTKLTNTMMGIYPSYYEYNGEKKQIVGTQFESTAARQAFPCVDEPEAKATFDMAIKYDEHPGETILGNMPEKECRDGVHYFETTKRMSTYLVAFAFGEMISKQTETNDGIKIGVFASPAHREDELDFSLNVAKNAIEFYEKFYKTPYPLPHSWQLALPDFSAGAMENWGLVTYREVFLLLSPKSISLATKRLYSTYVTHELAHQWFGDLVTMKWWDDLWLNESFANMMEYVSVAAMHPEWHMWEEFQTFEVPSALKRDAIDGVQPIHIEVEDPADIDSIFDGAIVYAKGARMLVMVRALIGDDALRNGLKDYFDTYKYSNATGDDLWNKLGKASGLDLNSIMKTWLNQPGYPVVSASIVNGHLQLSQKQFFIGKGNDVGRQWQIPLNSNYDGVPKLMKEKTLDLGSYENLKKQNKDKAFILNADNNSHFIVKYDETLMQDIMQHINNFDAITQREFLQDLHLLAQGGVVSYASLIPLMIKFAGSKSYVIMDALYAIADDMQDFVQPGSDEEKNLKKLYDLLSKKQFDRLGLLKKDNDDLDATLGRPYIVKAALYAGNQVAIEKAHEIFEQHKDNISSIESDVRKYIISNEVIHYGNSNLYNELLNMYKTSTDGTFQRDLCFAVTKTSDKEFINKLVNNFENSNVIRPQDIREWYYNLLQNDDSQQIDWDWIRKNWNWLQKTVGGDMEFNTYITYTARVFCTDQRFNEFKAFFEPKINVPGLTREIKMDINIIYNRVNLIDLEKDKLNAAIEKLI